MEILGPIFIILGIIVYFAPSIGAAKQENFLSIFIVNILFGWTVIGWIVCFVWASQDSKKRESFSDKTSLDKLTILADLKERGIITETEFEEKKSKILSE
jgi:predicted membrane protein